MSLGLHGGWVGGLGFPRVSGDEPLLIPELKFKTLFSPRERG